MKVGSKWGRAGPSKNMAALGPNPAAAWFGGAGLVFNFFFIQL